MSINNEKTAELIKNSKVCAIVLEHNPKEECFLLKYAVLHALKNLGISVRSFPYENEVLKYYKTKWEKFLGEDEALPEKSKTIIKIPKKDVLIKELSYNETDDFFSLIITPESGKILKESLVLEETLPEPDVFLCFFEDIKKLSNYKDSIKVPENYENTAVFFPNDVSSPNERSKSLTEKIVELLQVIEADFSENVINLLFAALIVETNKFKYYLNKDIFSLANFLLSRGANAKEISSVLESQKTDSFVQLLGRAAARTHYDDKLNTMWTFLQEADFEKTNNSPSLNLILKFIKELEGIVKSAKAYTFFWQKDAEIWIAFKSLEKNYLEKVAKILELEFKSDYLVLGPFQNFSEAELKVRETLNKIAYDEQKDAYLSEAQAEPKNTALDSESTELVL